jgi:Ca2+-binding EF-hand superfamily protein
MRSIGLGLLLLVAAGSAAAQEAARRDEFDRRDTNNDGRLTQAEYGGHAGNFEAMDCDKNGTLSEREFVDRYNCNDPRRAAAPQDAFAALDRDGNGLIARSEWRGSAEDFNRLDRDGDGVSRREYENPPAAGSAQARFQDLDEDNDGVVSRREWRHETVAFHRADRNADGVITTREYSNLPDATPEEARFDRADANGNGVLERREWSGAEGLERSDRNNDGVITLQEYLNPPPATYRDAFFEEMDHNEDGLLSRWEWHGEPAAFDRRDRNDDGLVTTWEFSHPQPGESTSDVRFRELDRDHDGLIEHSEWTGDWESFLVLDENRDGSVGLHEYLRTRPLDRRFALLDHDRSGTLSKEEWHGDPALFARLDRDRNGRLSRNEFPN